MGILKENIDTISGFTCLDLYYILFYNKLDIILFINKFTKVCE